VASGQIGCRYVKVLAAAVPSFLKFAHSRQPGPFLPRSVAGFPLWAV